MINNLIIRFLVNLQVLKFMEKVKLIILIKKFIKNKFENPNLKKYKLNILKKIKNKNRIIIKLKKIYIILII